MKNEIYSPHKSTLLGADANLIAMLSYFASTLMGWIPVVRYVSFFAPLIVYFIEKDSTFVRFHSMQAFLLNVISSVINIIYTLVLGASAAGAGFGMSTLNFSAGIASVGIAFAASFAVMIVSVAILIFNVLAMIGAFKYKEYHIPLIGSLASGITHTNNE